ncbi:MAG: sulfotransferase [Bacteroidia bacterium]|nr:sulfotransferase [Bacteroidia bacterium]
MTDFTDKLKLWLRWKTRSVGHLMMKEPQPGKWVFIVGCYNSGTTLLHKLLSAHPAIGSMPNEGQFYTDQLPRGADYDLPRLWALKPELFYLDENSRPDIDVNKLKRDWAWFYNDVHRPVLIEKTILNAARTRWLQTVFPNSYFISLFRNGYAVAEGIQRKEKHGINIAAQQWAVSNEILLNDLPHLKHHHELSYENLVSDPVIELKKITRFLQIEELPDAVFNSEFNIHKVASSIRDMNKDSLARLKGEDIQIVNEVAGPVLDRLAYPRL